MTTATPYAVALDIRSLDTGALLGVALVIPSERQVLVMVDGAGVPISSSVSEDMWGQIDAWVADGNARLPRKPPPLDSSIVAAIMGARSSDVSAQRFAAIPMTGTSLDALAQLTASLPGLLHARRSAA